MIFEKESLAFELLTVMELKQGRKELWHIKRNFDALSFRFKADTVIRSGGKSFPLSGGSVGFFPAMVEYDRMTRCDELIAIHFNLLNYHSKSLQFCQPDDPEEVGRLFREILEVWTRKEKGYRHRCAAVLYEIFALLYREGDQESAVYAKIREAVTYLTNNFRSPDVSIAQAARRSYISEVYFRKLFREEFGVSPKKYLIQLRIKYALDLIASGYYSLQEIASLCGYTDYKYFSTEFKRLTGKSPSQYAP